MVECKYCEINKRSRLKTFTFPDTGKQDRVCSSCYSWLNRKFNSKKVWKSD